MKKYILAIDQGTTSTRCIIFDAKQNIIVTSQKELKNSFPHPGWVLQDANEIYLSVLFCINEIFQKSKIKPSEIETIGITNQRETTIMWDKITGIPVYSAIVWQSRQTNAIIEKLKNDGYEDIIKRKTGLLLDPYFSASKIKWIFDNVEGVKDNKNVIFGTVDTWLVWKLTGGKVHITDVSNASRTLLFNIETLSWDDELLKIFDIDSSILPQICDTSCVLGNIEPYYFFNESPTISCIVGDQQAALFGQSCFKRGDVKNTYGTGGFILMNTGNKIIQSNHGLLSTVAWRINNEINYAIEGSIFVSGSLLQWMRDGLNLFDDTKETEKIARMVDSSEGVYIVPAFTGLGAPYWDDEAKGAIYGLSRGSNYRHLVRAALESMAYQVYDLIKIMEEESDVKIKELKVDGGASQNNFLLEFQSSILNSTVIRQTVLETTALGAARLAGLATGFYNMNDFKDNIDTIYKPKFNEEEINNLITKWHKAISSTINFK